MFGYQFLSPSRLTDLRSNSSIDIAYMKAPVVDKFREPQGGASHNPLCIARYFFASQYFRSLNNTMLWHTPWLQSSQYEVVLHESLNNLTPADVYFGRGEAILEERERIKRSTIQNRRLEHQLKAA
jgi:hypothetical protein